MVTSVDGESSNPKINTFIQSMLSRDSLALRSEVIRVSPDIELEQEVSMEGDTVKVAIPMTVNFFWPNSGI